MFYHKAIKDKAPDAEGMEKSIFAALYDCMSTYKIPQHNKRPKGLKT